VAQFKKRFVSGHRFIGAARAQEITAALAAEFALSLQRLKPNLLLRRYGTPEGVP
jgi:hypothetical protein